MIYTDLEGAYHSKQEIPNFEVTPGILAISESPKFLIIFQGEPPESYARAKFWVKKLTNYPDFVIKYFMSPQNFGENMVGVKKHGFFPHHCKEGS